MIDNYHLPVKNASYHIDMEAFWRCDKFRIRAVLCYQPTIGWLIKPLPGYIVQIMGSTLSGLRIAAALTGSPGPAPARKRG